MKTITIAVLFAMVFSTLMIMDVRDTMLVLGRNKDIQKCFRI